MMKRDKVRIVRYPAVFALAGTLGILSLAPIGGFAQDDANNQATATEDVIYLTDGRSFHGKFISEDRTSVRFEVNIRGQKSTRSFFKWDIVDLKRSVPVTSETPVNGDEAEEAASEAVVTEEEVDLSLPGIYVVPIRGQMGTDVLPETYEDVIDDIRAQKPACIVFEIDCDHRNWMIVNDMGEVVWPGEYYEFEDFRALVQLFKRELREFKQVAWVKNSVGASSVVALAWDQIYMMPEGRLDGLVFAHAITAGWQDPDVRAKMKSAWSGIVKSFIEFGKHDLDLADAMMFPDLMLSADFRGRNVLWDLDTDGEVVVDDQDKLTAGFDAEDARNLRISQETVDREGEDGLADLAFVLGFREYRKIKGVAEKDVTEYISKWRETYSRCIEALQNYNQYLGWATGEDEAKYLGQAKAQLIFIQKALQTYRAVERELRRNYGMDLINLNLTIKELEERIRGIKERDRQNPSRPGGPGAPGGGGGPRPG